MKIKIGIIGSTGYAGQEVTSFLVSHPNAEIAWLASNSQAGEKFSDIYPRFRPFLANKAVDTMISLEDMYELAKTTDCIFLALPHGASEQYIRKFKVEMKLDDLVIIDLGSDFRFANEDLKPVYGLSELERESVKKSNLIANPGCYPTAAALGILPLLTKTNVHKYSSPIIIDAKSGVSGAGRNLTQGNMFCEVFGNSYPYKLTNHRHTGEIENSLTAFSPFDKSKMAVQFTPNIIPINRGIIENIYIKMDEEITLDELQKLYEEFYEGEAFVQVLRGEELPNTTKVSHTNNCQLAVRIDERTKMIIVVSAIDNLIKGAAGQAVQNMNIRFGFEETASLIPFPAHL